VRVKVYAEGGENATHTHLAEDHVFLVLAGQATFHLGKDGEQTQVANTYEGVFLPKGSYYRFESSGDENLVMYRVGAGKRYEGDRADPTGDALPGGSEKNKHVEGVAVPGKFFGD
jgi:mannose-6-phosphate isomerase-like protein (cupin superfamily)